MVGTLIVSVHFPLLLRSTQFFLEIYIAIIKLLWLFDSRTANGHKCEAQFRVDLTIRILMVRKYSKVLSFLLPYHQKAGCNTLAFMPLEITSSFFCAVRHHLPWLFEHAVITNHIGSGSLSTQVFQMQSRFKQVSICLASSPLTRVSKSRCTLKSSTVCQPFSSTTVETTLHSIYFCWLLSFQCTSANIFEEIAQWQVILCQNFKNERNYCSKNNTTEKKSCGKNTTNEPFIRTTFPNPRI